MVMGKDAEMTHQPLTKEDFKQCRDIILELEQLEELLTRQRARIENPRQALSRDSIKTRNPRMVEEMMNRYIRLEQKYDMLRSNLIDIQIQVEETIEKLDSKERILMRAYYIEGKSWKEVADYMGYSEDNIYKIHGDIWRKIRRLQ